MGRRACDLIIMGDLEPLTQGGMIRMPSLEDSIEESTKMAAT